MRRARPARGDERAPQRIARTAHANRRVSARDTSFLGERLQRSTLELDPSKRIGVFRLERARNPRGASARPGERPLGRVVERVGLVAELFLHALAVGEFVPWRTETVSMSATAAGFAGLVAAQLVNIALVRRSDGSSAGRRCCLT